MTILCYHSVQPGWASPLAVDPEVFSRHCAWLAEHRRVLPLLDAVERLDDSGRPPRGLTAITFDDGFRGLYDHAMPVVTRHHLPVTVFLVAQTLTDAGQPVDWVDDAPPDEVLTTLDKDQVLEMQSAGVRFESHSYSHADLTQLSFDQCVQDLRDSRELLESIVDHPVRLLAYPRGRHDQGVRAAAERAGYTHAFSLPEGQERPGQYCIPRVGIYRGNSVSTLRIKSARQYLTVRTSPAYQAGQHLRRSISQWRQ